MEDQNSTKNNGNSGDNKVPMGVIAYIGPLVIISYLVAKDDPFVKFHIKQGLVLFVIEIALWFLGFLLFPLWMILPLIHLAILILAIIGIMNVVQGNQKKLPFVGDFSRYFNF